MNMIEYGVIYLIDQYYPLELLMIRFGVYVSCDVAVDDALHVECIVT